MNAENELTFQTKKSMPLPLKSLWLGFWRIVITSAMLAFIYYLFAVWGVILLVILAGRQVRAVLYREAQRNP